MKRWKFILCALAGLACANTVRATPPMMAAPDTDSTNSSSGGIFSNLRRSNYLLGDMGGLRPALSKYGVSVSILETSEVLGNVSGGVKDGADYEGLTQMGLQLDTQRAFGLYGGTFNVSALQIHGRNFSADYLQNLQTASGIEAERATRLWELWYQQKFLDENRLDVRIGQQSLDQEFMVSQNALLFVNTMFGWPMVPSADMPGGGPAYPLSAPGVRIRIRPIDSINVLLGVFNGSPSSQENGDSQQLNRSGTAFPLNGGALAIAEVQYSYPALGSMVYADKSPALSRTYRLGMWYDTQHFGDEEFDNHGLSLANPASDGIPASHSGDYAFYAVMDQVVWADPHDEDGDRAISVFGRAMGTPESNRNLVDFSLNAGLTLREPIMHRDDDSCGIGIGYTHVSQAAAGLDRDTAAFTGAYTPVRGSETFIEATYQYQLTPWCQLQPDFQYVFNPGGGLANPDSPSQKIHDEAILGMRVNILF
jgi:porin